MYFFILLIQGIITSLQMHSIFPKINIVAILSCGIVMYITIIQFKLKIVGFIIGFMVRFLVELIWELYYLFKHFPEQCKFIPTFKQLKIDFGSLIWFSFVYVIGYASELFMFEAVPIILFQSKNPSKNIALWMSQYQITTLRKYYIFL